MLAVKEGYEEEEKKKLKEKVKRKERDTRVTQEKNAKMIKERDKVTKDRKGYGTPMPRKLWKLKENTLKLWRK